jgi:hypothetical protein
MLCPRGQTLCHVDNSGYCLSEALKCNGQNECKYGEDESECSKWLV